MLEGGFHFPHGCEVNRRPRRFPEVLIAQWCNEGVEVVDLHTKAPEVAQAMHKELQAIAQRDAGDVAPKATGSSHLLLRRCGHAARSNRIEAVIEKEGLLSRPPVVYREGWEEYRAIAFDDGQRGPPVQGLPEPTPPRASPIGSRCGATSAWRRACATPRRPLGGAGSPKQGPGVVRKAVVQPTMFFPKNHSTAAAKYARLVKRRGKGVARVALAGEVLDTAYQPLTRTPYRYATLARRNEGQHFVKMARKAEAISVS